MNCWPSDANISLFWLINSYVWGCLCGLDVLLPSSFPSSAFPGAVISCHLSLTGIVFTCSSKPSRSASKKSACRQVRPGRDIAGREADQRPEKRPGVTQDSKTGYSKPVPTERRGAKLWQAGLLLLSVRQRMAASGGHGRAGDDWFMGWLAGVHVRVCMCVRGARSRWQIGKAADGPSSISTAGCSDVSILPSLTTAGQTRAVRVIGRARGCLSSPLSRSWVCVSTSEPLYLPGTIKVKVYLGGAVAEPRRQLTL